MSVTSHDSSSSSFDTGERDEVKEIQKLSQKETNRVLIWRRLVTAALIITAVAVTATTYTLLLRQEDTNFQQAYEQFARTLENAAIHQQRSIRDGMDGLARAYSSVATQLNATWPYFSLPDYESHAETSMSQTGVEVTASAHFVTHDQREAWEEYTTYVFQPNIKESHMFAYGNLDKLNDDPSLFNPHINKPADPVFIPQDELDYYWPMWHYSPPVFRYGSENWDFRSVHTYDDITKTMVQLKNETLSTKVKEYTTVGLSFSEEDHMRMHSDLPYSNKDFPHSFFFHPIHKTAGDHDSQVVGMIICGVAWDLAMRFLLPTGVTGIVAVLRNDCGQDFSYKIIGPDAAYLGEGDVHEDEYSHMKRVVDLALHTHPDFPTSTGHCRYSLDIFPSKEFEELYRSKTPLIFACVIAATFFVVIVTFYFYDLFVQMRNSNLVDQAARSNAIVTSLFPGSLRDKVLDQRSHDAKMKRQGTTSEMKSFLSTNTSGTLADTTKPLAEFFPAVTVMFADIVGFTAWSSVREPSQVFTLLETVYSSFDQIAKHCKVFKVETVGDCYVAVSGLPEFNREHALVMAKFARRCARRFSTEVQALEVVLGPDTADLDVRIGLHSGPVVAGVLRGERSRFQLFGDTMNTTARLESTSERGRIQVSKEAAELIMNAGKGNWLIKRNDKVEAKGKGSMETYWLHTWDVSGPERASNSGEFESNSTPIATYPVVENVKPDVSDYERKIQRLIDWNVGTMLQQLRLIVARREASGTKTSHVSEERYKSTGAGHSFLDEVKEIIELPAFDAVATAKEQHSYVNIGDDVANELRDYVTCIASMYRRNPFHNFEHASHVAMSVTKLLCRIVAPSDLELKLGEKNEGDDNVAATLHDHTYGITSDPLTQFACAFSAMIHDVDHTGVPNTQLIKENAPVAALYKNRSVAEQNSLDIAWNLLMEERFSNFRRTVFCNADELQRFRELVVNAVMATDIVDKELKTARNARWEKAFSAPNEASLLSSQGPRDAVNRKATIVIEHLIQASDVAHTMQHWHVYRKWNERLFAELYAAYRNGRATTNPAEFWAKGEIGFFDFYIIPLAKKLKDCGVFGVSSDEYLNYAESNRREWLEKGDIIVNEMVESLCKEYDECV